MKKMGENYLESTVNSLTESLLRLRTVNWMQQDYIRKKYNLRPDEFNIILHLFSNKDQRMRDLGDRFSIKLSTLTSIVDKIEKSKYVRRENSSTDRRSVYLVLTAKGKRLCDSYLAYLLEISRHVQQFLNQNELDAFLSGTEKIEETMRLKSSLAT